MEKSIEKCTITVKYIPLSQDATAKVYDYDTSMITKRLNKNNEEQLFDIKFLIIMNCKYGMRKTFIISISDCENLQAAFSTDNCSNKLNIGAKYMNETINCFSNEIDEVSFIIKEDQLYIKNYVQMENGSDGKSHINTQVNCDCDEFNVYEIEKETDITFCLKEFKVCLQFGLYFDLTLDTFFQKKGRPIIFSYNGNSTYKCSFTLATLSEDLSTSQSNSISSANTTHNMSVFNTSHFPNENIETHNRTKSKIVIEKIPKAGNQTSKGNKRTLFDTSNYLNNSNIPRDSNSNKAENDDDDDDLLLTQALDEQESKKDSKTPPSKRKRSLVQTLFDDNDEVMELDNNSANEVTKIASKISFANLLETSKDNEDSNDEDDTKMQSKSIYIEETDSEDD